mgnify:CR=1 FL=1
MADDFDEKPEWGSVGAKVETYNEFREIALEMGYPSMTEAFEDLATLRAKVAELETQLRGATIMFADTADTIATLRADLAKAVEGLEGARQQGQGEGFAAAVQQLRDMSAQKPLNALTAPAAVLANSLEQSRSVAQSLIKELRT